MEFYECLRNVRKSNNMTQGQIAGLLDCSQSSVSSWERGNCAPNIEQVRRLYRSLSLSLDEYFGEKHGYPRRSGGIGGNQGVITLERLRRGYGLSRGQLAEILQVSERTVCNWERNGIPHLKEIRTLLEFFRIQVNDLR